jgi:hypothetical protein
VGKTAILSVDILTDASNATAGFEEAGKSASTAADKIDSIGGKSGDAATGLGALAGALDAAGFGPAADALGLVATGLDAAEGSTVLFKVAQESLSLTTIKDTAARIANTVATTAANVATKAYTAGQWLLNAALSANPIGLVIAAVLILIGVIVLIATKTTFFQDTWERIWPVVKVGIDAIKVAFDFVVAAVQAVITWVGKITGSALETFKGPIDAIKSAFDHVVDAVKSLIDWVGKIKMPKVLTDIIDNIKKIDIWPFSVPGAGGDTTAPGVSATAMTTNATRGSGGVTINVNGALDPVSVARQLRTILRADDRRRRGVVIA